MAFELEPVQVGLSQRHAQQSRQFVGCILNHLRQLTTQHLGTLGEDQTKFGEQPSNTVDASGALFLVPLAQSVNGEHGLLRRHLERHEAHRRPRGRFADRGRVVGVVLAALALHAVRRHEVRCHHSCVEPQSPQLACPMVITTAGLHGDQRTRRQLRTPGHEAVTRQRLCDHDSPSGINRMNLDHALGQVDPYPRDKASCNLAHGLPLFRCRLTFATSILAPRRRSGIAGSPFVFG